MMAPYVEVTSRMGFLYRAKKEKDGEEIIGSLEDGWNGSSFIETFDKKEEEKEAQEGDEVRRSE